MQDRKGRCGAERRGWKESRGTEGEEGTDRAIEGQPRAWPPGGDPGPQRRGCPHIPPPAALSSLPASPGPWLSSALPSAQLPFPASRTLGSVARLLALSPPPQLQFCTNLPSRSLAHSASRPGSFPCTRCFFSHAPHSSRKPLLPWGPPLHPIPRSRWSRGADTRGTHLPCPPGTPPLLSSCALAVSCPPRSAHLRYPFLLVDPASLLCSQ